MEQFSVGDIVARRSYNFDIIFKIININQTNKVVDLAGITVRIIADSPIYDLVKINKEEADRRIRNIEISNRMRIDRSYTNMSKKYNYKNRNIQNSNPNMYKKESIFKKPGTVLHIDGDLEYSEKCKENYERMGITASVYNIQESEQYRYVFELLQKVRPNILILTGHDAFMRKRNDIYNINNYKNSKHFIQGVLEARRYEHSLDNLVIFAGACQSYYEAIIAAGANFASAPKRVLIDMMDPLIVAQSIAYTPISEFVALENIISNTREGIKGIGGMETRGQYRTGMPGI